MYNWTTGVGILLGKEDIERIAKGTKENDFWETYDEIQEQCNVEGLPQAEGVVYDIKENGTIDWASEQGFDGDPFILIPMQSHGINLFERKYNNMSELMSELKSSCAKFSPGDDFDYRAHLKLIVVAQYD